MKQENPDIVTNMLKYKRRLETQYKIPNTGTQTMQTESGMKHSMTRLKTMRQKMACLRE